MNQTWIWHKRSILVIHRLRNLTSLKKNSQLIASYNYHWRACCRCLPALAMMAHLGVPWIQKQWRPHGGFVGTSFLRSEWEGYAIRINVRNHENTFALSSSLVTIANLKSHIAVKPNKKIYMSVVRNYMANRGKDYWNVVK